MVLICFRMGIFVEQKTEHDLPRQAGDMPGKSARCFALRTVLSTGCFDKCVLSLSKERKGQQILSALNRVFVRHGKDVCFAQRHISGRKCDAFCVGASCKVLPVWYGLSWHVRCFTEITPFIGKGALREGEGVGNIMKFEHTQVYNFDGALRGMRNPLNSWDRSDSRWENGLFVIGEKDLELCRRLIGGGTEHRKFMRQIFVCVDITAPLYWWSEYDTYKVGTAANSTSTMHTLSKTPITLDMFEIDPDESQTPYWESVVKQLEELRQKYNETKDYHWFRCMKQQLPAAFRQTRTCTFSYENVRATLGQRHNHRLSEWSHDYVAWAHTLPYAEELLF